MMTAFISGFTIDEAIWSWVRLHSPWMWILPSALIGASIYSGILLYRSAQEQA